MPYSVDDKLVIGVASSALFDLTESDAIFQQQGEAEYRKHQAQSIDCPLKPGIAFPFIKRLLSLNDLSTKDRALVEVIVLSRNDPDTGLRVMRSINSHKLPITRAIFTQGSSPHAYMKALNMSLFLTQNGEDVKSALEQGFPAGQVVGSLASDTEGTELRVAFDFDGVLADDSSESVMNAEGLTAFHEHEVKHRETPLAEGQLVNLLRGINRIQDAEQHRVQHEPAYNRRVRVSIVTARNAPSHERVVHTLQSWGVSVNDAFFLGGIEKARILRVLRPHIFFDDQLKHLEQSADEVPSVHIPFGVANRPLN